MNKILRIVGPVVLVIALACSALLFVQKNKEHNQVAGMQERLTQAQADYEKNEQELAQIQAQISSLREGAKLVVKSASLPLYETSQPTIPRAKLSKGEAVYVNSTDDNGMAYVTAEVNGEEVQYYTFASLLGQPGEDAKTVVVSLDTVNRENMFDQELPFVAALAEALRNAGFLTVYAASEELCGNDWNLIASDCSADAHLIISAGAVVEEGRTCFVGIPMDIENADASQALARRIASMLAINNLAEAPVGEDQNSEVSEAADSSETEDEEAEDTGDVDETLAEDGSEAAALQETSVQKLTCQITVNILNAGNAEEPSETEADEASAEEGTDSEEAEGESENVEDAAAEGGMDQKQTIVNCIVAGMMDYFKIQ